MIFASNATKERCVEGGVGVGYRRERLRVAVEGIRADAPHLEVALERAVALLSV